MRKIKVGISIDEILRAKWLQFDRYYVQEFAKMVSPIIHMCMIFLTIINLMILLKKLKN